MSVTCVKKGNLEYLSSSLLEETAHCFSTRYGGVSQGHFASLNLGVHRGDSPENVHQNYGILGQAVGFDPAHTVFTKQIHSDLIERVGRDQWGRGLLREVEEGCDGLVTNEPLTALTVFSADCTPVLLYDPVQKAIGAVHAGWRGTAMKIAAKAVLKMTEEFGSRPEDIHAAIGPCIGQCCFETHNDVPDAMLASYGEAAKGCICAVGEKFRVDLKGLNALSLRELGVTRIDIAADCTACAPHRFWSHRRVGNERGSLAAVIMLKGEMG